MDLARTVTLKDGRQVAIRPLSIGDQAALAAGFQRLSMESRILRFGNPTSALTRPTLRYLVESVDGTDHVAFAAFAGEGTGRMVGVGRILRYPDDPSALDVGITVADDYQRQGLGLVLAQYLELQRPRPASRIITQVAAGNKAALRLLEVFGHLAAISADGSVEVDLSAPAGTGFRQHRMGSPMAEERTGAPLGAAFATEGLPPRGAAAV